VEPPPDCESQTYKYCAYKPVECAGDSDCDEGFECKAQEVCSASGGCACAVPACDPDGGECPVPEPCECETEPVPEPTCEVVGHYCEAKQIECESATDCPTDWECVGVSADCACPAMEIYCDPASSEECPEMPACDCGSEPTVSYCMPGGWAAAAARDYAAAADGSTNNNAIGEEQSPTAAFMDGASKAAAEHAAAGDESAKGSGGCSFATTATAGFGTLFVTLLALLGLAVRRSTALGR
jgi:MYXO-CTERM domain-containing protein